MRHKKPWIAFVLSFALPGAGLAYLGRWGWAAVNFLAVQAIVVLLVWWQPEPAIMEHFHYVILALAAGSAGWAHAAAGSAGS